MVLSHSNGTCDSIAVKIKNFEALIICMYRPPDTKLEEFQEALETVQETIDKVAKSDPKTSTILQCGDYNFPFISWPSRKMYFKEIPESRKADAKKQAEIFLNYCDQNFLEQYISTPTRGLNVLDLVLTNNCAIINTYTTIVNKKFSDHFTIKIWLNISYNQDVKEKREYPYSTKLMQYDFLNGDDEDWLRFDSFLGRIDIEEEVEGMNTKEKLEKFYEILENVVDEVFTKKKEFTDEAHKTENKPKNFIPKKIRQLMKKRSKLSGKIQASRKWWKTYEMMDELETIESAIDVEYKKRSSKEEEKAVEKIKKDQHFFYNYAKKKSKIPNKTIPIT